MSFAFEEQQTLGAAGNVLIKLMNIIKQPDSSIHELMDARARLGVVIQVCCSRNLSETIKYISKLMETLPMDKRYSMILVSSFLYAFDFMPVKNKKFLSTDYEALILKHTISLDSDHLATLSQFLQSGGSKLLICPEILLRNFLYHYENYDSSFSKSIATLIRISMKICSVFFWEFWIRRFKPSHKYEHLIFLLSDVVMNSELMLPSTESILIEIEKYSRSRLTEDSPFPIIEASLNIMKWLIKNRYTKPLGISAIYGHSNLNASVISCWSEYISYCDLSDIPEFPPPNDMQMTKAYASLIDGLAKNPNMSYKISIPYWLWECIQTEFGDGNSYNKVTSIENLSHFELDIACNIAHILPSWIFIHAIRYRTQNSSYLIRLIRLISYTPHQIIQTHIDEFVSFITRSIISQNVADEIVLCIRNLIVPLKPHLDTLIQAIVSETHFLNNKDLCPKITVLDTLLLFSRDDNYYLDLFDSLWEALSLFDLSLSQYKVVFRFAITMARKLNHYHKDLIMVAYASIFAMFPISEFEFFNDFPIAQKVFRLCCGFYTTITSDIVTNPLYSASASFPLTSHALMLIKNLEPLENKATFALIKFLPNMVGITPIEATIVADHLLSFAFKNNLKRSIFDFCQSLVNTLERSPDAALVMISSKFLNRINGNETFNITHLLRSNVFSFSSNIYHTRLCLQMNPVMMPLLLQRPDQLNILFEYWAPAINDTFISVVSSQTLISKTWKEEYYLRSLLYSFGCSQPQPNHHSPISWISRTFLLSSMQIQTYKSASYDQNLTINENMNCLSKNYSFQMRDSELQTIICIIKQYQNDNYIISFMKKLLMIHNKSLIKEDENSFRFINFLYTHNISFPFPKKTTNPKVILIGVRHKELPINQIPLEQWAYIDYLRLKSHLENSQIEIDYFESINSTILKSRYPCGEFIPDFIFKSNHFSSEIVSSFMNYTKYHELYGMTTEFARHKPIIQNLISISDFCNPIIYRSVFSLIVSLDNHGNTDISDVILKFLDKLYKVAISEITPLHDSLHAIDHIIKNQGITGHPIIESISNY